MNSFIELFSDTPDIHIVDVGASPIDGDPVYLPILKQGGYRLIGFEPNPAMYKELIEKSDPRMSFLPYALGDGQEAVLNICSSAGMSSTFEPDFNLLSHFHGFADWGRVVGKMPLMTHRVDDIDEVQQIDFLKLDVQGSELSILENAVEKLKTTLFIHVETLFIPFYKGQPVFGDIDVFLRKCNFLLHRFGPMVSRVLKPLALNNDIHAGLSQVLWSDAVYVRSFTGFRDLDEPDLLKIARMAHEIYGSYDLATLALHCVDRKNGTNRHVEYLQRVVNKN